MRRLRAFLRDTREKRCPHGHAVTQAMPGDSGPYPRARIAEPWPCAEGCTREEFERELAAWRRAAG